MANNPLSAAALRATFDAAPQYTVGVEEEVILLDPERLEPTARALDLLPRFDGDPRFKPELPASQIEIVIDPDADVGTVMAALAAARRELAARTEDEVRLAAAGVSPLGSGAGELNQLRRYKDIERAYGPIARRQLVCALQVHVSIGDADGSLAVYNAVRSYLPLIAALAANAPFYEGRDTGLASVRPKLGELLPRQGVPPVISSWDDYAAALEWGRRTRVFPEPGSWWWELRLHPRLGTLEFRVPDSQSTVADAAAVTATIQALVAWLDERRQAGEALSAEPTWRIEENRWLACRGGVDGELIDPESGARRPTRECLADLLAALRPVGARLGASGCLEQAARLMQANGAVVQRQIARRDGVSGVAGWLVRRFLEPWGG
ncbi:MAG TPA: YbdK family carboxylate-amine ligase [Solirubrobacteraceae bacterium]|nr:YbdK family carboxylate-amine ligase [Solirubrobacteraceae bacterium]